MRDFLFYLIVMPSGEREDRFPWTLSGGSWCLNSVQLVTLLHSQRGTSSSSVDIASTPVQNFFVQHFLAGCYHIKSWVQVNFCFSFFFYFNFKIRKILKILNNEHLERNMHVISLLATFFSLALERAVIIFHLYWKVQ